MMSKKTLSLFFCTAMVNTLPLNACEENEFKAFSFCLKNKYFDDYIQESIKDCSQGIDQLACIKTLFGMDRWIRDKAENDSKRWFPFSIFNYFIRSENLDACLKVKSKAALKILYINEAQHKPHDKEVSNEDVKTFLDYYEQSGTLPTIEEYRYLNSPSRDLKKYRREINECRIFALNKKECTLWKKRINLVLWSHYHGRIHIKDSDSEGDICTRTLWQKVESDIEESLLKVKKLKKKIRDNI